MSAAAAHRLPDRRRLLRHRRRQGAARARRRRSTASRRPTASAATGSSATSNGMSAAYRDLHINTSRERMAYSDFPMPADYPDYPHHTPDRRVLRRLRRPLRLPRPDHLRDARRARRARRRRRLARVTHRRRRGARLRRRPGRQRPPLEPALARARVPRLRHLRRASRCTPTPTWTTSIFDGKRRRRAGHGQLGDGHRRRVLATSPRTRSWPRAAARGSSPSTFRPARRPAQERPADPVQDPPEARSQKIVTAADAATRATTACPSPTTSSARRTRRSPGRILDRIQHGASRPSRTSRASTATTSSSPTAPASRRRRRLLHRLQDHVPVLRRGLHLGARQPHRAVPPRLPPRLSPTWRSSACCSRSARSCRWPRRRASGSPTTCGASTRCPPPAELRADIAADQEAMRKRYVASKRHTIQVDFDDYLLRAGQGARGGRRARAARAASRCRSRAGSPTRRGPRQRQRWPRRERRRADHGQARADQAGQPRRDPRRRARGLRRHRLRRRDGARHRPRHRPGDRHVLQLLPRQGVGARRAAGGDRGRGARARARRAARGHDARGVRPRAASAPTSTTCSRTARLRSCSRRNAGTIRALFDEPSLVAGVEELAEDLRAGVAARPDPRARRRVHGRRRWSAPAFEIGARMLEQRPDPDPERATAFVSELFVAGTPRPAR